MNERGFEGRLVNPADLRSLRDAAREIGVTPPTLWLWVQAGKLARERIGNSVVVEMGEVRKVDEDMRSLRHSIAGRTPQRTAAVG